MSSLINKKTLEYLAELARVEVNEKEERKLLEDPQKILDYFEELKTLDTSKIEPLTGGLELKNIFREDEGRENPEAEQARYGAGTDQGEGVDAFPETENGFLKIPPVFE